MLALRLCEELAAARAARGPQRLRVREDKPIPRVGGAARGEEHAVASTEDPPILAREVKEAKATFGEEEQTERDSDLYRLVTDPEPSPFEPAGHSTLPGPDRLFRPRPDERDDHRSVSVATEPIKAPNVIELTFIEDVSVIDPPPTPSAPTGSALKPSKTRPNPRHNLWIPPIVNPIEEEIDDPHEEYNASNNGDTAGGAEGRKRKRVMTIDDLRTNERPTRIVRAGRGRERGRAETGRPTRSISSTAGTGTLQFGEAVDVDAIPSDAELRTLLKGKIPKGANLVRIPMEEGMGGVGEMDLLRAIVGPSSAGMGQGFSSTPLALGQPFTSTPLALGAFSSTSVATNAFNASFDKPKQLPNPSTDPIAHFRSLSRIPADAQAYFHTPQHLLGRPSGEMDPVGPWGFERELLDRKPFGALRKRNFWLVQEHQATAYHFDLRLQVDGGTVSWAIPKGFLGLGKGKEQFHLAVQTPVHPISYSIHEGSDGRVLWDIGEYKIGAAQDAEHSSHEDSDEEEDPLGHHQENKLRHALYEKRTKTDKGGDRKRSLKLTLMNGKKLTYHSFLLKETGDKYSGSGRAIQQWLLRLGKGAPEGGYTYENNHSRSIKTGRTIEEVTEARADRWIPRPEEQATGDAGGYDAGVDQAIERAEEEGHK